MKFTPNTALEPTPVTPGSFRFRFLVYGSSSAAWLSFWSLGCIERMDKLEPQSRFTGGFTTDDNVKFKRYLVGELFWELEQHEPMPPMFVGVSRDDVEVLMYRGYDDLRVRIAGAVYDIVLSWQKLVPPSIKRL